METEEIMKNIELTTGTAFLNPPSNFSHKGTQRKKEYPNHTNEKLLEVQKPFLEKVLPPEAKVDGGFRH
jgi:hypothetical protein